MIKKLLIGLAVVLVLAGALAFAAARYHFIKTEDKTYVVKKAALSFEDTYVDTRKWTLADWALNGNIRNAVAQAEIDAFKDKVNKAVDKAVGPPIQIEPEKNK